MSAQLDAIRWRKPTNEVVDRLRIELILRGLSTAMLAARCGLTPMGLRSEISRAFKSPRTCWLVEAALNYEVPLCTDSRTLHVRRYCKEHHGFDPYLCYLPELRGHARRLGVDAIGTCRQRKRLVDAVMARLAVNPKGQNNHQQDKPD
jgi:hypothetical protein